MSTNKDCNFILKTLGIPRFSETKQRGVKVGNYFLGMCVLKWSYVAIEICIAKLENDGGGIGIWKKNWKEKEKWRLW